MSRPSATLPHCQTIGVCELIVYRPCAIDPTCTAHPLPPPAFQNEGKLYMVLNYLPGGELFYRLKREGR